MNELWSEFPFHNYFNVVYAHCKSILASGMEPMCWSSFMTSSMQLAKECLSQRLTDDQGESFQPLEGLEKFAETIETGMPLPVDHKIVFILFCFV